MRAKYRYFFRSFFFDATKIQKFNSGNKQYYLYIKEKKKPCKKKAASLKAAF